MRVLLTRAAEDAGATAERLRAMGHDPIVAPLGSVTTLRTAWPDPLPGALAVTSAHALPGLLPLPDGAITVPVFAVGERSAAAARAAGFAAVETGPGDGEALATLMAARLPPGGSVLYAAGRVRKPLLEAALGSAGLFVIVAETYAVEPVTTLPDEARAVLQDTRDVCALHYSRGTTERFVALARSAGLEDAVVAMRHLCLSADVAAPLHAAGARWVGIAGSPREPVLLDLVGQKG
jgi:uroporphyrinogen-III synthase